MVVYAKDAMHGLDLVNQLVNKKTNATFIKKYQDISKVSLEHIETISDIYDGSGLFEDKKIFLVKSCNGLNENSLNKFRETSGLIVFVPRARAAIACAPPTK